MIVSAGSYLLVIGAVRVSERSVFVRACVRACVPRCQLPAAGEGRKRGVRACARTWLAVASADFRVSTEDGRGPSDFPLLVL